jgi:hypothetical protein
MYLSRFYGNLEIGQYIDFRLFCFGSQDMLIQGADPHFSKGVVDSSYCEHEHK